MTNINSNNQEKNLNLGDSTGKVINISHSGSGSVQLTQHLKQSKETNNDDNPMAQQIEQTAKSILLASQAEFFTGWDDWECNDPDNTQAAAGNSLKDPYDNDEDSLEDHNEKSDTNLKETVLDTAPEKTYYNGYKIPQNLKKPFQTPVLKNKKTASVTPFTTNLTQLHTAVTSNSTKSTASVLIDTNILNDQTPPFVTPYKDVSIEPDTDIPKNPYTPKAPPPKPSHSEATTVNKGTPRPPSPVQFTQLEQQLNLQDSGIYVSPHLDKKFIPSSESLRLTRETEPLREVIMSQHRVFTQCIIDLGRSNLNLSRFIVNKKLNLAYLNDNTKTPRSLRLNCGIVTSPALQNHPDFIQIQEDFQNDLLTFIKKGTAHMAKWQRIYIHILTIERCSTLLKKALPILEGLISFFTETLEAPKWPSIPTKRINLLILKLYLTTDNFDTSNLLSHLEMPHDQVLLTASKLITGQDSDEKALAEINSLNLSDLDFTNTTEHEFLSEILTAFNQILDNTIVQLWLQEKEQSKKTKAALNLQAKMESRETIDATAATALAIAKATEHLNNTKDSELRNVLRISNLEKNLKKQEQRNNEFQNKYAKQQKFQKNSSGSRFKESTTSPTAKTPPKRKTPDIDLTKPTEDETQIEIPTNFKNRPTHQKRFSKQQKLNRQTPQTLLDQVETEDSQQRSIQWNTTSKVKSFNPSSPATKNPFTQEPASTPLYFQPAPPPTLVNMHTIPSYTRPHPTHTHYPGPQLYYTHIPGQNTIPYSYYPPAPHPNPFNQFPPPQPQEARDQQGSQKQWKQL